MLQFLIAWKRVPDFVLIDLRFSSEKKQAQQKASFSRFIEITSQLVLWTRRVCKIVVLKPIIYEETSTYALLKDIAEIMIRNVVLQ